MTDSEYESGIDHGEVVEVEGEDALCCPGCGQRPGRRAVWSGVEASCSNDDCAVNTWSWYDA